MEFIKWANSKGQTLILTKEEAGDLLKVLEMALVYGECDDGKYFEIEIETEGK